jgi:hypothetical protein
MNKLLAPWGFKTLQEFKNIYVHITNKGRTVDDVIKYISDSQPELRIQHSHTINNIKKHHPAIKKSVSVASVIKPCIRDRCPGKMELFSVCCSDNEKKKQGYKTKFECDICGKVEYSKQTLEEVRKTFTEGKNGTT